MPICGILWAACNVWHQILDCFTVNKNVQCQCLYRRGANWNICSAGQSIGRSIGIQYAWWWMFNSCTDTGVTGWTWGQTEVYPNVHTFWTARLEVHIWRVGGQGLLSWRSVEPKGPEMLLHLHKNFYGCLGFARKPTNSWVAPMYHPISIDGDAYCRFSGCRITGQNDKVVHKSALYKCCCGNDFLLAWKQWLLILTQNITRLVSYRTVAKLCRPDHEKHFQAYSCVCFSLI